MTRQSAKEIFRLLYSPHEATVTVTGRYMRRSYFSEGRWFVTVADTFSGKSISSTTTYSPGARLDELVAEMESMKIAVDRRERYDRFRTWLART